MIKLAANLSRMIKRSEETSTFSRIDDRPLAELRDAKGTAGDYAMYGGAGALGGAGLGALINYLRDKSVAEGALVGAGLGGAAGLGTRGVMDYMLSRREQQMLQEGREREGDALSEATGGLGGRGTYADRLLNTPLGQKALAAYIQSEHDKGLNTLDKMLAYQAGGGMGGAGDPLDPGTFRNWRAQQNLEQQRANTMGLSEDGLGRFDPAALEAMQRAQGIKPASATQKRAASSASDYALYGGGGALGGAGLGALINYLRDKSVAQGALVGGGLGGAAGLGTRGIMDYLASAEAKAKAEAEDSKWRREAPAGDEQARANLEAELQAFGQGPQANEAQGKLVERNLRSGNHLRAILDRPMPPENQAKSEELRALLQALGEGPQANEVQRQLVELNTRR